MNHLSNHRRGLPAEPAAVPPPGPTAQEVLHWQAEQRPVIDLLSQASRHGPVSSFELQGRRVVMVTQPPHVMHVLVHRADRYQKRSHRAQDLLGQGLLSSAGELWARQRRLVQPQFTTRGMRQFEKDITGAARRMTRSWEQLARQKALVDLTAQMRFFAMDTMWRALTGRPLDEDTHRQLQAIETAVQAIPSAASGHQQPTPAVRQALATVDSIAFDLIADARQRPAGDGLVRFLVQAAPTQPQLTDHLIRDELVSLLVAGHETTAKTLTWAWLLLSRNPGAEDQVLKLWRDGDARGYRQAITAVLSETLRLYPPAWLIPRTVVEQDHIDGWLIPAGADALVCPYLTHRDPALWPDPERFDPGRFAEATTRQRGAYYPFGIGPRTCVGQRFALTEAVTLLDALLRLFQVELTSAPENIVFGANLHPDGPLIGSVHQR